MKALWRLALLLLLPRGAAADSEAALAREGDGADGPFVLAFASCMHQDKESDIVGAMERSGADGAWPDVVAFLGDNFYNDVDVCSKGAADGCRFGQRLRFLVRALRRRVMPMVRRVDPELWNLELNYRRLGRKLEAFFSRGRAAEARVIATWDDHDFLSNDSGGDAPLAVKRGSQRLFTAFWRGNTAVPGARAEARGAGAGRDGIFEAHTFGRGDRVVQVLVLDTRFHRSPLVKAAADGAAKYAPHAPGAPASMLGDAQWEWLRERLREPAALRIVCSSVQVLSGYSGAEAFANFPDDQRAILRLIAEERASGVVFVSGDVHYGELSAWRRAEPWYAPAAEGEGADLVAEGMRWTAQAAAPYTLYDLTSSGITEVWPHTHPNVHRVGPTVIAQNYGRVEVSWAADVLDSQVRLQLRTANETVKDVAFALRDLQFEEEEGGDAPREVSS